MDKHEQFKRLYKKFVDGTRWLNKRIVNGTATQKDRDDFKRLVSDPMDAMWETFTDEDKHHWNMVKHAVDLFDGTIILEDEEKKKRMREEKKMRKKKWKRYFHSH